MTILSVMLHILKRFGLARLSVEWECEAIEIESRDGWRRYRAGPIRAIISKASQTQI